MHFSVEHTPQMGQSHGTPSLSRDTRLHCGDQHLSAAFKGNGAEKTHKGDNHQAETRNRHEMRGVWRNGLREGSASGPWLQAELPRAR